MTKNKLISASSGLLLLLLTQPVWGEAAPISRTPLPSNQLRNAVLPNDALARTMEKQRVRQKYQNVASAAKIVRIAQIGASAATKLGFVIKGPNTGSYVLVETKARDFSGLVIDHLFLYDPATHFLAGELDTLGTVSARNQPVVPISY